MHEVHGSCHCGNIHLTLTLPQEVQQYSPRACDCTFCRKHAAAYLSDPLGSLHLVIERNELLGTYHQGDGIADCLFCTGCGVLVGILYTEGDQSYATINSRILEAESSLAATSPVSPRLLPPDERVSRWKKLWFKQVTIARKDS